MAGKRKIIYVANVRFPTERAHGAQIAETCECFAKNNFDLTLVVPKGNNIISQDIFEYYNVSKIFNIKYLRIIDLVGKIPKFGFWFSTMFFILAVKKNIKIEDPQTILYTRDEYLLPILQKIGKRVVWESHSLPQNIKYYLKFFRRCHKIIVLTQKIKDNLVDFGITADNILVSPDGVDLDIFDISIEKDGARKRLSLPEDKIVLGYTGSLKTKGMDKGVADILNSLLHLPENVLFVAVGGIGIDIDYYKKMAEELGVISKVLFIEKVKQSELAIYQKSFDILLMPFPNMKHYAYYMSPLKMFEYMAAKRPIISSDLPSIREVLSTDNAVLVKPDNPELLAQSIVSLLADNNLAEKISNQAFEDVKKYTWENRTLGIINFI